MTASNGAYLLGYVCVWLHTTVIFCSRKEIPHPRNVDLLFLIWKSLFPCVNLVGVLVVCWLHSPNLPECFVTHRVTAKRGFAVKIIPSSPLLWIGMENWALFSTSWKSKASVCSVQCAAWAPSNNRCPSLAVHSERLQDTWWFRPEFISG